MMSDNKEKRVQKFIEYADDIIEDKCLDVDNEAKRRIMDEEARIIKTTFN